MSDIIYTRVVRKGALMSQIPIVFMCMRRIIYTVTWGLSCACMALVKNKLLLFVTTLKQVPMMLTWRKNHLELPSNCSTMRSKE